MVGGKQHALFVPDFSSQPPEIINEQGGGGIMPQNEVEIKLGISSCAKIALSTPVL